MDNLEDKYLSMGVLSLTLIFLGIFITFFVRALPLPVGVIISLIGVIIGIKSFYHIIKILFKVKKENKLSIFAKEHLPALLCIIVFILMIGSFVSATVINEGTIFIEPDSRGLIIYSITSDNAVSVKGPFVVDSALENESNVIRMPLDAMDTLGISVNDTMTVNDQDYVINESRASESDIIRLPIAVKNNLTLTDGNIIQNINLGRSFEGCQVAHNNTINSTSYIIENFILTEGNNATFNVLITMDNKTVYDSNYILYSGDTYVIAINGQDAQTIEFNGTYDSTFDYNGHVVNIKIEPSRDYTIRNLISSPNGVAIDFYI